MPQTVVIIPISTGCSPMRWRAILYFTPFGRPVVPDEYSIRVPSSSSSSGSAGYRASASSYELVAVDGVADDEPDLHARHLVDELLAQRRGTSRDDEHLRVAVVEDVRDLVGVEVRVDAREEEARPLRGPARLEVLDAVLHEHRDVIAEAQPRVVEQLRELVRAIVQPRYVTASPGAAMT